MGNALGNTKYQIALCGLDGCGKTTLLYHLKLGEYTQTVPTVGFNHEKIQVNPPNKSAVTMCIWDVGGQDHLRPLWRSYCRSSDGIVFVVDSQDTSRLEESRLELDRISQMRECQRIPLLILANKQDLPGALPAQKLSDVLEVSRLSNLLHAQAPVMDVCAINGEGLPEALLILHSLILSSKSSRSASKRSISSSSLGALTSMSTHSSRSSLHQTSVSGIAASSSGGVGGRHPTRRHHQHQSAYRKQSLK